MFVYCFYVILARDTKILFGNTTRIAIAIHLSNTKHALLYTRHVESMTSFCLKNGDLDWDRILSINVDSWQNVLPPSHLVLPHKAYSLWMKEHGHGSRPIG